MKIPKITLGNAALVAICIILLVSKCDSLSDIKRINQNLNDTERIAEIWKDKDGKSHAKVEVLESSIDVLKITHKDKIDSLVNDISGLKAKNLLGVVEVDAEVTDTVTSEIDSLGNFTHHSDFATITGVVRADSVHLSYIIKVPIQLVTYKAKRKLLSFKKYTYVEAVSVNKNVSFSGISKIKVSSQRRRVGFGLNFSYGVGREGLGFHLGFGLQYRLF